ncbi:hypothetical protein ANCDUO_09218 [Ancylostoma duodenale]|uniref:Uncharacterized protein n=1 Tax=Ancylostoma duodenale TaxID=51022 RepID=A0A0C2CUF9_9BILA|nr:hypothetical protein ANCDUO_09218 [Ancylostoma duodenale]
MMASSKSYIVSFDDGATVARLLSIQVALAQTPQLTIQISLVQDPQNSIEQGPQSPPEPIPPRPAAPTPPRPVPQSPPSPPVQKSSLSAGSCSQLGEYALPSQQGMELLIGVESRAPKKDNKLEYECSLEGMAGLILKSRKKGLCCPKSLGIFPLIFETMDGQGGTSTNKAALEAWDNHLPNNFTIGVYENWETLAIELYSA